MSGSDESEDAPVFDDGVKLDFSKLGGLVPVVLQDVRSREVVMVGFVDEVAWRRTLRTGNVTLFRRSLGRVEVMRQGNGSPLAIERVVVDCDADSVVLVVFQTGSVCHRGDPACFVDTVRRVDQRSESVAAGP